MEPEKHPLPPARTTVLATRSTAVNAGYYPTLPAYASGSPDSGGDNTVLDFWRLICRHKLAIILTSLAGLLIGFAVGIPMTPVYRVGTALEVLNLNEDFMNLKRTNPVSTADTSYDVSEAETQTRLLKSDALLDRVMVRMDPAAAELDTPSRRATSGWRAWLHLDEPVQLPDRVMALARIADTLKIKAPARTRVIEATVESTDPNLAASFVNTLAQEFIQKNLEDRFAATHRTSDWLNHEIGEASANLRASEQSLQAYARSSGLIFTDANTNVATEKLQEVQEALSAATAERIARQARFELARNSPPDTIADVLNDPGLKETNARINDLRRQVADLSTVYSPQFSKVKRAEAELAVLEAAFEHSRADILKRIENDFQEASTKEKLLAAAYDAQTREVSGQDEKAIQYNILKREVDSNRQLYDTMLQQTKESSIASALHASSVRIVDPAKVPRAPIWPDFRLNSAMGLVLGLILSLAMVTIRERADRTLQQPGDIKQWTDLAELGSIPAGSVFAKRINGSRLAPDNGADGEGALALRSRSEAPLVEMSTWQQKPGLVAEAFRSALISILFVGDNGSRPRVLVFTSPHPSDGKTTVTSNLAIATAEIRRKVLVVDADLRRPRMHQIFGLPNDRGLADLLRDDLPQENAAGLIQATHIPHLHVLPAGESTQASAHLLNSLRFPQLLAQWRNEYDMILIDTPPMLPMADARVAGKLADAVVLVARSGKTTRDALLAAKERLTEDCIRVLGTILNDWDPQKTPGGYYGHYEYTSYEKYSRHSRLTPK